MPPKSARTQNIRRTPGSASGRGLRHAAGVGGAPGKSGQARVAQPLMLWAVRLCVALIVMLTAGHRLVPAVAAHWEVPGAALQGAEAQGAEAQGAKPVLDAPASNKHEQQVRSLAEGAGYEPEPTELGALEDDASDWVLLARSGQSSAARYDVTLDTVQVARGAWRLTTTSCPRGPPRA